MKKLLYTFLILSVIIPNIVSAGVFNVYTARKITSFNGNKFNVFIPSSSSLIDMSEGGVVSLGSGVSSTTFTFSSDATYDITRSSLFYSGIDQDSTTNNASSSQVSIYFNSDGKGVTVTRGGASTLVVLKLSFWVVEWAPGVTKSVQRGETFVQNGATSNTATISSVTTANSFVNMLGSNSTSTQGMRNAQFTSSLTNSTTVTNTRSLTIDGATSTWQVTEFNPGYVNSIQEKSIALTGVVSNTASISAVTTNESMLFLGGFRDTNGGTITNMLNSCALTNSTTITAIKGVASGNSTITCTVVDFNPTYLNSNTQSGSVLVNTALTGTASISSVNTTKSLLSWGGLSVDNTNLNRAAMYIGLTNGTTVTGTKGNASAANASSTFMVLESK
jgi:hypothetical protein